MVYISKFETDFYTTNKYYSNHYYNGGLITSVLSINIFALFVSKYANMH